MAIDGTSVIPDKVYNSLFRLILPSNNNKVSIFVQIKIDKKMKQIMLKHIKLLEKNIFLFVKGCSFFLSNPMSIINNKKIK